jgi:hypothetical protein
VIYQYLAKSMSNPQNTNHNLTLHFKVKDFGAWRQTYNNDEKGRSAAGITNGRVFHGPEDPNDVVILQDVSDESKARTWLGSDAVKTAMQNGGVIGTPSLRFAA